MVAAVASPYGEGSSCCQEQGSVGAMSNIHQGPPARKRRAWLPWAVAGGVATVLLLVVLSWVGLSWALSGMVGAGTDAPMPKAGIPMTKELQSVGSTATADVPDSWTDDPGDGVSRTVDGFDLAERRVFMDVDGGGEGAMAVYSSLSLATQRGLPGLAVVTKAMIADQVDYPVRNSLVPLKKWNPGCVDHPDYAAPPRQKEVPGGVLQMDVAYTCANMFGRSIAVTRVLVDMDLTVHCLTVVADAGYGKQHKESLKSITDSFHIIPAGSR